MAYLQRFGSVTVLNGHIHQIVQKVDGNITFHIAATIVAATIGFAQGGAAQAAQTISISADARGIPKLPPPRRSRKDHCYHILT